VTGPALLFDLGGVLHRSMFELLDPADPRFDGVLDRLGPFGPEPDELWAAMRRKEISERDYWDARAAEIGRAMGHEGWVMRDLTGATSDKLSEAETVRPEARALLDAARAAGVPVAVLTNDLSAFHDASWVESQHLLTEVGALVDCSTLGFLKPDPRAYRAGAEALGRDPENVIFLDDQPWNAAGARAVGMTAIDVDIADPAPAFRRACELAGLAEAAG
jgi:putative hydrolase of the HAD superfamily